MATPISRVDDAGRTIAGLLTYNPGPGIYSRLERAIQQMPENVRVQELPGLLKRYKDGVPGWELKAVDLDSAIAGRDVVPKAELLAAVKERSPVYTHGEVVLGGAPQTASRWAMAGSDLPVAFRGTDAEKLAAGFVVRKSPEYQRQASPLGGGVSHGEAKYEGYGQGGEDYTELLLTQRPRPDAEYGNHWAGIDSPSSAVRVAAEDGAVAHARFDTHGDALRINELQSDLGIHNRKMREQAQESRRLLEERGVPVGSLGMDTSLPFPLEDAWADILIKRLALEAARKGHRAIEVASPRAIADKVGGNIDNYEHFYGKVVPGALERLGRKMGGMTEDGGVADDSTVNSLASIRSAISNASDEAANLVWRTRRKAPGMGEDLMQDEYDEMVRKMVMMRKAGHDEGVFDKHLMGDYESAYRAGVRSLTGGHLAKPRAMRESGLAVNEMIARAKAQSALEAAQPAMNKARPAAKRYIMSDEMRRRIIEQGIGASLLAPVVAQEGE